MFNKTKELEESQQSSEYLTSVARELEKMEEKISSVILFGSFARGDNTEFSDLDLLIVFKNNTSEKLISNINKKLTELENRYDFLDQPEGVLEKLIFSLKRKTGMSVSHFVCKEEDVKKRNIPEIFSTEKYLSYLIAPGDLVLNNIGEDGIVLYGKPLTKELPKPVEISSMLKSLIMNFSTATGSLAIAPFYQNALQLSSEAVKWSLLAIHQFLTQRSGGVEEAINFLKKYEVYNSKTLEEFKSLRTHPRDNPLFIFKAPLLIIMLHFEAIKYRGM